MPGVYGAGWIGGGNDLILNSGTFDIGESIIDGGEELILERNKPVEGLNIFRQGFDPYSDSSESSSGLNEFQLFNFAAVKLEQDGDWIFPQGQDCQVRGKSKPSPDPRAVLASPV